jgi:hypothetical protein
MSLEVPKVILWQSLNDLIIMKTHNFKFTITLTGEEEKAFDIIHIQMFTSSQFFFSAL